MCECTGSQMSNWCYHLHHLPIPYLLLLFFHITHPFLVCLDQVQVLQVVFQQISLLLCFLFLLAQNLHLLFQLSVFHQESAAQTSRDTLCIVRLSKLVPATPTSRNHLAKRTHVSRKT